MTINSIIVDDEKNSREVLQTLLAKFCPEVKIVGEASSVAEAYQVISKTNPDLVFLDIEMPMGNGFSLLQKFNTIPFSVIFITSYDHYAIHAIKFSAIDYLLKPVETSELKCAVSKAMSKKKEVHPYIINLLNNVEENTVDKKIPFHVNGSVKFINTSSITHIEADSNYTTVFCKEGKYTCSKTLKDFLDFLAQNRDFIQINKGTVVNLKHLKEYSKGDAFTITLTTGHVVTSSRRRKPEILKRLDE